MSLFKKGMSNGAQRMENSMYPNTNFEVFMDFNISFKTPKSDTCSECDALKVAIETATIKNDEESLKELCMKQEVHHRTAQAGQDAIKEATNVAINDPDTYVITFDLQQALPQPKLFTGPTLYKKKMFCYHFSIHSFGDGKGYFYL